MRPHILTRSLAVGLGSLTLLVAHADESSDRLREMVRRTQEALRQAQAENATLSQGKSEAEGKVRELTKKLEDAEAAAKKSEQTVRAQSQAAQTAQAAQEQARVQFTQTTQQLASVEQKQAGTAKTLAERENELKQVKQALEASQAATGSCENKNVQLYEYGQEILDRYRHKGVWAALAQKDPVLGLKDVQIQNVVQEYRLKLENARTKP